jgi:hypothetical protein
MPAFKYTMIFVYQSGISAAQTTPVRLGGWSESYYAQSYSGTVFAAFQALCQARVGICPLGTSINRIRVQQVQPTAASTLTKVAYSAPATWLSDVPQMALKIPFFTGTNTGQFLREFRGVPDVQVTLGEYTPTAPYTAALTTFITALQNGTWSALRRDKSQTSYGLVSIDATGNVVMAAPFTGIAVGRQVQILRTVNPMNGRRFGYFATVIAVTDPSHFQIAGLKVRASTFGTIRTAMTYFSPFTGWQANDIQSVVRKVGRPSRSYSGRASRHQ